MNLKKVILLKNGLKKYRKELFKSSTINSIRYLLKKYTTRYLQTLQQSLYTQMVEFQDLVKIFEQQISKLLEAIHETS